LYEPDPYHQDPVVRAVFVEESLDCNAVSGGRPEPKANSNNDKPKTANVKVNNWLTAIKECANRPERPVDQRTPVTLRAKVGGQWASVLIDPGSEVDIISPHFLESCKNIEVRKLAIPVRLSMAVVGSQAYINYGVWLDVEIGPFSARHYADVQKCPKVDMIMGMPFLNKHNMTVGLGKEKYFTIGNLRFPNRYGYAGVSNQVVKFSPPSKAPNHVSFKTPYPSRSRSKDRTEYPTKGQ
jgi:hypothetical protein